MCETKLHIKAKPYLLYSVLLFFLCFFFPYKFSVVGALIADDLTFLVIFVLACTLAGLVGSFVICGTVEAVRAFRSDRLGRSDLVAVFIYVLPLAILFFVSGLFPDMYLAMEILFWLSCLAIWPVCVVAHRKWHCKDRGDGG